MTSRIKRVDEYTVKLQNSAGDTVLEFVTGPCAVNDDRRGDGQVYYSISSRMLCISKTSTNKAEVLVAAREALRDLMDALETL